VVLTLYRPIRSFSNEISLALSKMGKEYDCDRIKVVPVPRKNDGLAKKKPGGATRQDYPK
jgi:hypothetical protein